MDLAKEYGCKVFNDTIMMERLPHVTYKSLKRSIDLDVPLDSDVASIVATAMKDWAVENGATHFTHWFQPMTGITAGKHDSFISPQSNGTVILEFSGKELIKGEPDASSFPNGGLRNTFEARGYTVWDCTSPAFIKGKTLYIPTAFCSYTGEALDTKTPLLHSMEILSDQAVRILRLFGNLSSTRVIPTVGAEQEYFLIDRENYERRLDLKICGRTLFGVKPPKGQEMDDHYCGRIRLRISDYMNSLDEELWKLGISAKTKHNEVAPAQHELAPIFESCNVATDHNQLTMEVMRTVAKKNGLACLLHEKPFAHINGSGKHNNWSLSTDDGQNLLDPGETPYENIQFLIFLCAILRAVDLHAGLLRMAAASAGNDHRLGAQEAPPAIISVFLGEHLTNVLQGIADGVAQDEQALNDVLVTNVESLPNLAKDDSDRNRTSPFAFTGNKFEFRMVGASSSISGANMVLNTIVAESLEHFADILEHSKDFDADIQRIISDTMRLHGRIIFNGNGYTEQWEEQAEKLGLPNLKDVVQAAEMYLHPKTVEVFEHFGIFSRSECQARYEIMLENYSKTICIEANTMLEMIRRQVIPSIIAYIKDVAQTYHHLTSASITNKALQSQLETLSSSLDDITHAANTLADQLDHVDSEDLLTEAKYYRDCILKQMVYLRECVDSIEPFVGKEYWGVPTVTDIIYRV